MSTELENEALKAFNQYAEEIGSDSDKWEDMGRDQIWLAAVRWMQSRYGAAISLPDIDPKLLPIVSKAIRDKGDGEMHGETSFVEFSKNPELQTALYEISRWLPAAYENVSVKCPDCNGRGGVGGEWCVSCNASGKKKAVPKK